MYAYGRTVVLVQQQLTFEAAPSAVRHGNGIPFFGLSMRAPSFDVGRIITTISNRQPKEHYIRQQQEQQQNKQEAIRLVYSGGTAIYRGRHPQVWTLLWYCEYWCRLLKNSC